LQSEDIFFNFLSSYLEYFSCRMNQYDSLDLSTLKSTVCMKIKCKEKKNIEVHQFFLYLSNLLKYLTDAPSADI
jgi:hypothetical protein